MKFKKYKIKKPKLPKLPKRRKRSQSKKKKTQSKKKKTQSKQKKHRIPRIPKVESRLDRAWKYGATIYYVSATILVLIVIYFSLREGV